MYWRRNFKELAVSQRRGENVPLENSSGVSDEFLASFRVPIRAAESAMVKSTVPSGESHEGGDQAKINKLSARHQLLLLIDNEPSVSSI